MFSQLPAAGACVKLANAKLPSAAALALIGALAAGSPTAFASYDATPTCAMLQQQCLVHAQQMQDYLKHVPPADPTANLSAFSTQACANAYSQAEQSGTWPSLIQGQPTLTCKP